MLGFCLPVLQVLTEGDRHSDRDRLRLQGDPGAPATAFDAGFAPGEEPPVALGLRGASTWKGRPGGGADEHLAGFRSFLHLGGHGGGRAGENQFLVGLTDAEEMNGSAVEPHRHLEVETSRRGFIAAGLAENRLHLDGGTAGLDGVVGAGEDEGAGRRRRT